MLVSSVDKRAPLLVIYLLLDVGLTYQYRRKEKSSKIVDHLRKTRRLARQTASVSGSILMDTNTEAVHPLIDFQRDVAADRLPRPAPLR
jgi:hypothetical protein